MFQAEVCLTLCDGSPRQAERRFGWGRETIQKGLHEYRSGLHCLEDFRARGRRRSEDQDPQLAQDIRAIVEPQTYADPELKSARRSTNCRTFGKSWSVPVSRAATLTARPCAPAAITALGSATSWSG